MNILLRYNITEIILTETWITSELGPADVGVVGDVTLPCFCAFKQAKNSQRCILFHYVFMEHSVAILTAAVSN